MFGLGGKQYEEYNRGSDVNRVCISELVGQEKYQKYLPYFPVCAECNRLYTAEATEYIVTEKKVKYKCHDTEIGSKIVKGCGHEGESDITKDLGKLLINPIDSPSVKLIKSIIFEP